MRVLFLAIGLLVSTSALAMSATVTLPRDSRLSTQPAAETFEKYRLSEKKPFPLQKYLVFIKAPNALFDSTRMNAKIDIHNAETINMSGTLNLISYDEMSKAYKFEFKLDQKINLEKMKNGNFVYKEIPCSVLFENRSEKLLLTGHFIESGNIPVSESTTSGIVLTVDAINHLTMIVNRPVSLDVRSAN